MGLKLCTVGILGQFLVLHLFLKASAAPHESLSDIGLSSSSTHTRRIQTEINQQCERPSPPMNGHISCIIRSIEYSCIATCSGGYTFPDGSDTKDLRCLMGQWLPYATLEDCTKESGGDNIRSSFQTSNDFSSFETIEKCQVPSSPSPGHMSCALSNNKYSCIGTCMRGYAFPDGSDTMELECSGETGQWLPHATFGDCSEVNKRCEMPSPPNFGSVRCRKTNDRHSCTVSCMRGYAFPDGSNTVQLVCSGETGQWLPHSTLEDCTGAIQ